MDASHQFVEWSAGHSQWLIRACRQLCLKHRKLGHKIDLEDLARISTKDQRSPDGEPVPDHATSYPSADGIDWDLFPYEDTQGPLLSPDISRPIDPIPDLPVLPESVIMPSTEALIGEDGFHVDRWVAGVPDVLPPATQLGNVIPPTFRDTAVQVSFNSGDRLSHRPAHAEGPSMHTMENPATSATPDIVMAVPMHSCNGTDISSAGLSVHSSEIHGSSESDVEASSDMQEGTDMEEGSDMEESDDENEDTIAAAYTGD
jgi:hypothetical protein